MRSLFASLTLALVTLAATVLFRITVLDELARQRREMPLLEDVLRSPGPDLLALAAMEHAPAWADVLWLQIVQDLGARYTASYDRVERWANIAVDLDDRYFTVYYASAIHLLVYARRPEPVVVLLNKGRVALPDRWELPFLLGYNAYFLKGDPAEAADFWEAAAKLPGAARFIGPLAARARFQAGDEGGAIAMLESMLDYLEGPALDDARIRLKMLRSEPILQAYDQACQRFLAERGRRPADGAELAAQGFVSEKPFDLLDAPITIDEHCRARTRYIFVREDEAKARIGSQRYDRMPSPDGRGGDAGGPQIQVKGAEEPAPSP